MDDDIEYAKCPECGHEGPSAASEEVDAFGGWQCEACAFSCLVDDLGEA